MNNEALFTTNNFTYYNCFIFIWYFQKNTRVIPTPLIGQEVPLIELETIFFEEFETKDLADILKSNKIKIINFWASWCLPCEVEHPILMGLSKKSDLVIIGINYKDTEEGSARFLNEKGNPYDVILIDDEGILGIEMGLTGVPETFVVNQDGIIIYRIVGPINNESRF